MPRSFCFFLCTVCQKHSYILYTLKSETAVLWWRLCKLDCDLRSYVRRVSLSGCEWFLKGPYSWRKPDFGEKSYLWSAFFNLWNRRTKIFPCWVFMILFVLQSLDLFFFNLCSTCASLRRSISNLFVCCLLSKLFPLISSWWRQCDLAPHTCWYCTRHLDAFKLDCTLWITCTFLCTVTLLWFYNDIHLNVPIMLLLKAFNWPCSPFWPNSWTVFYCQKIRNPSKREQQISVFLQWIYEYRTECDYAA